MEVAPPNVQQPGRWVGHYTTAAIAFEQIIPAGELRMSPRRELRDPIDSAFVVPGTAFWVNKLPQPEVDWGRAVSLCEDIWGHVRVLSLTQDVLGYDARVVKFGCCWARARLWEHYAENHRGVCLVFDRQALEQAVTSDLGADVRFRGVDYSPGGIAITDANMIIDPRVFKDDERERAALDWIKQYERELFFLKTDEWQSEHELRAVLYDAADGYAFASYGDALQAVVLGSKCPGDRVTRAEALAHEHDFELKKVVWTQARPWLKPAV
jgi:hypothetical protein